MAHASKHHVRELTACTGYNHSAAVLSFVGTIVELKIAEDTTATLNLGHNSQVYIGFTNDAAPLTRPW